MRRFLSTPVDKEERDSLRINGWLFQFKNSQVVYSTILASTSATHLLFEWMSTAWLSFTSTVSSVNGSRNFVPRYELVLIQDEKNG